MIRPIRSPNILKFQWDRLFSTEKAVNNTTGVFLKSLSKFNLTAVPIPIWGRMLDHINTDEEEEEEDDVVEIKGNNILILNLNHTNAYGHIYTDVMPEICFTEELYPEYDCIITVVSQLMKSVIDFFGFKISDKIKVIDDADYIENFQHRLFFKKLTILNHCVNSHFDKKNNIKKLKSIMNDLRPIPKVDLPYLIYCSRNAKSAKHGRRLIQENEDQIIKILKEYAVENHLQFHMLTGIESDGSATSLYKQYELFTNAKIVVGPHGGVFSNLIFLDTNKKPDVIEFTLKDINKNFINLSDGAFDDFCSYRLIKYVENYTWGEQNVKKVSINLEVLRDVLQQIN